MPNQHIYMNLIGPCKTSDAGNKYVLTIKFALTKYGEKVAITKKEAITMADAIFTKWICHFGCPAIIHTDMEKEFIKKKFSRIVQKIENKRF